MSPFKIRFSRPLMSPDARAYLVGVAKASVFGLALGLCACAGATATPAILEDYRRWHKGDDILSEYYKMEALREARRPSVSQDDP